MSASFDPYYTWLAIPPAEQPPTFYRLLGIPTFEANPDVIENAADQRMVHLRGFQSGKYAALSQKLLNEVAAARVCLLNAEKKRAYDDWLRARLAAAAAQANPHADPVPSPPVEPPVDTQLASFFDDVSPKSASKAKPALRSAKPNGSASGRKPVAGLAVGGALVGLAAIGLLVWGLSSDAPTQPASGEDHRATDSASQPPGGQADAEPQWKSRLLLVWPADQREDATLVVDRRTIDPSDPNVDTAPTHVQLHVDPGVHRVQISRPGYKRFDETVKTVAGKQQRLDVDQEPASETTSPEPFDDGFDADLATASDDPTMIAGETGDTSNESRRAPVPPMPEQQAIGEQIEQEYRVDASADPAEKLGLAGQFLNASQLAEPGGTRQYVLLRRSMLLACDGGDPALMLRAVEEMSLRFEVDEFDAKAAMLAEFAKGADDRQRMTSLSESVAPVVEAALEQERLAAALRIIDATYAACRRGAGADFRQDFRERARAWFTSIRDHVGAAAQQAAIDKRIDALDEPVDDETTSLVSLDTDDGRVPALTSLGPLEGRDDKYRGLLARACGGSAGSERAVALALKWLAAHQMPDGGWSFDHAAARGGVGTNGGDHPQARNAATGLALLAYLGAGQTQRDGRYQKQVERGLSYLGSKMRVTKGTLGSFHESGGTFYSHGIATQALCEVYTMTRAKNLQIPAQMAVNYIVFAQHPQGGGWRYEVRQRGDTSVTGWQVAALKTAEYAHLKFPAATLTKAKAFLDSVQTDGGAQYGYKEPGDGAATSAAGLLCRIYTGWPRDYPALKRGAELLAVESPSSTDLYFNYYATQVMRHVGGPAWDTWIDSLRDYLVDSQADEGNESGSWHFRHKHAEAGGRLYCTVLATLILESPYRFLPVYEETRREDMRRIAK